MQASPLRYAWHAKSYGADKASIRLRVLEPMRVLRERGLDVGFYCEATGPAAYAAIIFSKSFAPNALCIAREARSRGRAVIFDISDNLFAGPLALRRKDGKLARLSEMMALATHVTVPTSVLAAQITEAVPEVQDKVRIIPDALDGIPDPSSGLPTRRERHRLDGLRRFLDRHRDALHCVWFGKSQGNVSGIAHLDAAVGQLELFSRRHPVTLTVISNKRWRYWKACWGWSLPTHYLPWTLNSFHEALALHRVAVIPVEKNGYTVGKSINRPATAILAGLGVVADAIPSYEELRPFIALDNWQGGLQRYLDCSPGKDPALEAARERLQQLYGPREVACLWERLLLETVEPAAQGEPPVRSDCWAPLASLVAR